MKLFKRKIKAPLPQASALMQRSLSVLWQEFSGRKQALTAQELTQLREMGDALWEMHCSCQHLLKQVQPPIAPHSLIE